MELRSSKRKQEIDYQEYSENEEENKARSKSCSPATSPILGTASKTSTTPRIDHVSKRARRIAAIGDDIGGNDKAKGIVRYTSDGSLEWKSGDVWKAAVYHQDIRRRLIQEASNDGLLTYDHQRASGSDPHDITCFHADHKTWGAQRSQWPDVLFQIRRGNSSYKTYIVNLWTDEDRIVLDMDNNPIKDYTDIPRTCSSEMQGYELEAIQRMDSRITFHDLRARMPHERLVSTTTNPVQQSRKQYTSNALNMRASRFRQEAGCLSWSTRAGTKEINDALLRLYPQGCLDANSSQNFRNLTRDEQMSLKAANKGGYSYRKRCKEQEQAQETVTDAATEAELAAPTKDSDRAREKTPPVSDESSIDSSSSRPDLPVADAITDVTDSNLVQSYIGLPIANAITDIAASKPVHTNDGFPMADAITDGAGLNPVQTNCGFVDEDESDHWLKTSKTIGFL